MCAPATRASARFQAQLPSADVRVTRPRPASSADVARLAGVSRATVSAVVNGNKFVTASTRERVVQAIALLEYRPDAIARSLKISRTNTIGLILPSIESPFWPPVARAAESLLRERGYRLFLTNTDEDSAVADMAVESLLETRVDGAIAAPPAGVRRRPFEAFVATGRPLVFIERAISEIDADCVMVDDVRGGYLAARHLLNLGHHRIGVVAMPLGVSSASRRVAGIRQALVEAGLTLPDDLVAQAHFSERDGLDAMLRLLARQPRPDAIVACSLRLTTGAFAGIHRAGLRVPDDVAIVGYDEMPWAILCDPPLTVVQQPTRELGRVAARLLLSRLDGSPPTAPVTEVLQPRLLVRRSCGANAADPAFLEFEADPWDN
jgi:LacI family transcriptional regulator, galactose operon repressor